MESIQDEIPFDFVLSYNQEHRDVAIRLLQRLEGFGLKGWIDVRYYYIPSVPMERQITTAWEKSRFIILLALNTYRDSEWCRVEYGEGLSAESALPLRKVLVLKERFTKIPERLKHHPSFFLKSKNGVKKLAAYIMERRRCMQKEEVSPDLAVLRWRAASKELQRQLTQLDHYFVTQLASISTLCDWVLESFVSSQCVVEDSVILTIWERGGYSELQINKPDFLNLVCSDSMAADCFPFHIYFFGILLYEHNGRRPPDSEVIYRLAW
ncbi:toll/interleukin-1 receptor domain-containing protein [Pseudomonas alkylphenolica]|uniref:toll/interleukin-1 receptor domain-containing protein n=1 Tax=Pseudomonas alkylphenolica TaxID=237609 RepID=UPI001E2DB7F6|nr:toll/interleukin-1 receptor domain-containing protein [Pseudomonas alkylphenolica]